MSVPESDLIKTELELTIYRTYSIYSKQTSRKRRSRSSTRHEQAETGTSRHKHKSLLLVFFLFLIIYSMYGKWRFNEYEIV